MKDKNLNGFAALVEAKESNVVSRWQGLTQEDEWHYRLMTVFDKEKVKESLLKNTEVFMLPLSEDNTGTNEDYSTFYVKEIEFLESGVISLRLSTYQPSPDLVDLEPKKWVFGPDVGWIEDD